MRLPPEDVYEQYAVFVAQGLRLHLRECGRFGKVADVAQGLNYKLTQRRALDAVVKQQLTAHGPCRSIASILREGLVAGVERRRPTWAIPVETP